MTDIEITERLGTIMDYYLSHEPSGNLVWKLDNADDEAFLIDLLKNRPPSDQFFTEASFYLGKYYKPEHKEVFVDALHRAAKEKNWQACYQVMISLENIGESPFDSERIKGETGFGFDEDKKNEAMALEYLRLVGRPV